MKEGLHINTISKTLIEQFQGAVDFTGSVIVECSDDVLNYEVFFKELDGNFKGKQSVVCCYMFSGIPIMNGIDSKVWIVLPGDFQDQTVLKIKNGLIHCNNGPAILYQNGFKRWFLNGYEVTAEEVFEQMSDEDKEKAIWNLDQWK